MKRDLYADVSARIIAELERGAAPWIKPWSTTAGQNVPQNAVTNRPYSGCNVILLWFARNRGWATPRFGERAYAAEELVAELGAAFLSAEFGFDGDVRSAGYIATWIDLLKADKRAFFTACNRASKAAHYLRGLAIAEAEAA